ncbi:MAG: hypothetical protein JJU00_03465 [Opitutales bacterium]|nr:hypothetical protein [Opitutales bacterium]
MPTPEAVGERALMALESLENGADGTLFTVSQVVYEWDRFDTGADGRFSVLAEPMPEAGSPDAEPYEVGRAYTVYRVHVTPDGSVAPDGIERLVRRVTMREGQAESAIDRRRPVPFAGLEALPPDERLETPDPAAFARAAAASQAVERFPIPRPVDPEDLVSLSAVLHDARDRNRRTSPYTLSFIVRELTGTDAETTAQPDLHAFQVLQVEMDRRGRVRTGDVAEGLRIVRGE